MVRTPGALPLAMMHKAVGHGVESRNLGLGVPITTRHRGGFALIPANRVFQQPATQLLRQATLGLVQFHH